MLVTEVLTSIDDEFDNVFSRGITGVAFILSKPLVKYVPLVDDDISF